MPSPWKKKTKNYTNQTSLPLTQYNSPQTPFKMALAPQLDALYSNFIANAPAAAAEPIIAASSSFKASYDPSTAIQVGEKLPKFVLSNAAGKEVSSTDLLAEGPLLITFYRGGWCPFCNIALRGLQLHLDTFKSKGVTLVAISPELPDHSLSTAEKLELAFPVLSDVGNKYAKELGILWAMPDSLRPSFKNFGHDLPTVNGDDSFAVPIPATFLVDAKGIVRNSFIDADYKKRLEPTQALEWVDAL